MTHGTFSARPIGNRSLEKGTHVIHVVVAFQHDFVMLLGYVVANAAILHRRTGQLVPGKNEVQVAHWKHVNGSHL